MLQQRVSDVRTQIYLPASWHQQLVSEAQNRGVSVAALIRESLSKTYKVKLALTKKVTEKEKERAWRRIMKLAGFAKQKDKPNDVSSRPGYYWAKAIEEKLKKRGAI